MRITYRPSKRSSARTAAGSTRLATIGRRRSTSSKPAKARGKFGLEPPAGRTLKADLEREAKALHSAGLPDPAKARYRERSTVERINDQLKDDFGGRHVPVRDKVLCHLMFGILALTVELLRCLTLRKRGPGYRGRREMRPPARPPQSHAFPAKGGLFRRK